MQDRGTPPSFGIVLEEVRRHSFSKTGCAVVKAVGELFKIRGKSLFQLLLWLQNCGQGFKCRKESEYIHAIASRGRHDSSLMVLVETLLLVCPLRDRKTDCIHNAVLMLVNVCMVWVLWQSRNCRIATRVRQAPIDGDFGRDQSSRLSISGQENRVSIIAVLCSCALGGCCL